MFDNKKKQSLTDIIIDYLSKKDSAVKFSQIANRVKISSDSPEYEELRDLVHSLEENNIIEKLAKKKYQLVSKNSYNLFTGTLYVSKMKSYIICDDNSGRVINIRNKYLANGLNGDIVKVEVIPDKNNKLAGKVVDIVERNKSKIKGKVEFDGNEYYFVPDSENYIFDFFIPDDKLNGARVDDFCKARLLEWNDPRKSPSVEIVEVIHNTTDYSVKFNGVIEEYELPTHFPEAVIHESEQIEKPKSQKSYPGRLDLRDEFVVTIDPDDAKDFDDALSLQIDSEGNRVVGVHIADVSHYIKENSELDIEARNRGNSTYLADRVVPMLPERLSNDICSLKPRTIRFAYSVLITYSKKAHILDYQIVESVIKSKRRYTYDEVLEVLKTGEGENAEFLLQLNELAKQLREKRFKTGGINFESSEVRFKFDENKKPIEVKLKTANEATQLIEEFMLAANQVVAKEFSKFTKDYRLDAPIPAIYRIHEEPDPSVIREAIDFVSSLGKKFSSSKISSSLINTILEHYHDKTEANLVNQVLIRSLPKAIYDPINYGHFGLGFADYTHFTSPIRRYCDLIVHRLLKEYVAQKPDNERLKYLRVFTHSISKHISQTERSSMEAERASAKLTHSIFMSDKIGQEFDATISGVVDFGIFVVVDDFYAEGLLKVKDIDDDYYVYEEKHHRFIGRSTKKQLKVGVRLRVKLIRVNIDKRIIDFSFVNPENSKKISDKK